MKSSDFDLKLIDMLRQKQQKQGIKYLTTKSGIYKLTNVCFWIFVIISTVINLIYILSASAQLSANLGAAQGLSDYQKSQASGIKSSIYTVAVFGIILMASLVFAAMKKYIIKACTCVIPAVVLIFNYKYAMSENIDAGNIKPFIFKHLVPLALSVIFCIVSVIIAQRQKILDKKGIAEISEKVYKKYSVMANDLSDEQWQTVLQEYSPENKKFKRSQRKKAKKDSEENPETLNN